MSQDSDLDKFLVKIGAALIIFVITLIIIFAGKFDKNGIWMVLLALVANIFVVTIFEDDTPAGKSGTSTNSNSVLPVFGLIGSFGKY